MPVAIYAVSNNPVPRRRSTLPLPLPLFVLACIAIALSLAMFIISMFDLGYLSMWMNPIMAIVTILFLVVLLVMSPKKRSSRDSTYFSTVVVCAYLIGIVWFVAFILTNIIAAVKSDRFFSVAELRGNGLPATVGTQRAQVILALLETVVLEAFAIKGHLTIREDGDPEDWKPKQ